MFGFTKLLMERSQHPPIMFGFINPARRIRGWQRRAIYVAWAIVAFFYVAFAVLLPSPLMVLTLMPFLFLVLTVIWALPVGHYRPFRALDVLLWAFFVSQFLWPMYLAIALPGLPWINAARLTIIPLLFLMLIATSSCEPYRARMSEILSSLRPLWIFVTLFAVIQVLSIGFSAEPFVTVNRVFNNETAWTAVFFAAVWLFRSFHAIERWCLTFVALTVVLCFIAIAEARVEHVLWAKSIPSFLQVDDEAVGFILSGYRRLTGEYRVIATAGTPLTFAELLALAVPFVLYLADRNRSAGVITLVIMADILVLNAVYLSYARLGFVGFLLGHFLFFFYLALEHRRRHPQSLFSATMLYISPVIAGLGIAGVLLIGRLRVMVLGGQSHQYSNEARSKQWTQGLSEIWNSPIFGFGANQGGRRLAFTNSEGKLTIDSHMLSTLLDYGFVGFLIYYGMFFYAIWRCVRLAVITENPVTRSLSAAFAIFFAEFVIIKTVLYSEINHPLVFMALGAVVALHYHERNPPAAGERATTRS